MNHSTNPNKKENTKGVVFIPLYMPTKLIHIKVTNINTFESNISSKIQPQGWFAWLPPNAA
jgi:hypothetical protein